jgi:hypothetical protein
MKSCLKRLGYEHSVQNIILTNLISETLKTNPQKIVSYSMDGQEIIRLPKIIYLLTNGGVINKDQEIELEISIRSILGSSIILPRIEVISKRFSEYKTHFIHKYTQAHLRVIVGECANWIENHKWDLLYDPINNDELNVFEILD